MRAGWPIALQRLSEAVVSLLPLIAVLFLPLGGALDLIYPWRHPETFTAEERELLTHKASYLNGNGFIARGIFYFVVWIVTAELVRRWSQGRGGATDLEIERRRYRFSAAALPPVALALSFASFDWIMSLNPLWYSTMFPVYFFAGGFVAFLALLTTISQAAKKYDLISAISPSHFYALGRLLFGFTVFWGYAAYFQLMLIWIADKPDEVTYYLQRSHGARLVESVVVAAAQFVIPFAVLLNYRIKRNGGRLSIVALWVLVAHYLDMHWLIAPSVRTHSFLWQDLAALFAVGGLCTAACARLLRGRPLVPTHDSRLPEALGYQSS